MSSSSTHALPRVWQRQFLRGFNSALMLFMSVNALAGTVGAVPGMDVAGLRPDRRPEAPVISEVEKGARWYVRALTGVELPYPWSLQFINAQGNWYTPFSEPGMTGKYDLRRWHPDDGLAQEPTGRRQ